MYSKGDIVVINFPYSDLINTKKRPMVVLAERDNDIIGCAITSNLETEGISLETFQEGSLPLKSKIKYWQINTCLKGLVLKKIGKINNNDYKLLTKKINELISL